MSRKEGMIYCNRCGRVICAQERQDMTSFLAVRKNWGYFSDQKDGMCYSADLCENCCDALAGEFVIAPTVEENTELV